MIVLRAWDKYISQDEYISPEIINNERWLTCVIVFLIMTCLYSQLDNFGMGKKLIGPSSLTV